jgi:hypothetical protein
LFDFGYAAGTVSTNNRLRDVTIRMAVNPSTTYLGATRPRLVHLRGDNMDIAGLKIYADASLSTATYPHLEINGADNVVDNVILDSYGIVQVGASSGTHARNTLSRFVRKGTAASVESFIYLVGVSDITKIHDVLDNNALSGDYVVLSDGTSAGVIECSCIRPRTAVQAVSITGGTLMLDGRWIGSATYNPASLADGAGATTTVTVSNAQLGDIAEASFSLDLQGILLTAWVSAADTVSVRFQNETAGVIDLGSGAIRAAVRQRQRT